VTQEGKVHACGEGTNGRLGLSHSSNVSAPRQMSALSQYVVKKVAVHSGGKHAMALTVDGKVFSWVSRFLRFFLYYFEIFTNYRLFGVIKFFKISTVS
jgi:alpha-tubulin suppressor-like RCC1 family protein